MKYLTYIEYQENGEAIRAALREQITTRINETTITLQDMYKNIGIMDITLRKFMNGHESSYRTTCKVYNYLNQPNIDDIDVSKQS